MSTACLLLLLTAVGETTNWPGFLGAGATPIQVDSLPLTWSPTEKIAWATETPGHGQSSPVIWNDRAFVTAIEGPNKETCHVVALSMRDGAILWKEVFSASEQAKNTLYISRAAPTPVTDGKALFAYFESGDVVALALEDGKQLWSRSLSKDYGSFKNKFGLSASPVLTENAIIVLVDDEGPSYLVALDKQSGQTLWKTERKSRVSWSSPAIVPAGGSRQVVVSSAGSVDGYDPASGKQLWSFDEVGGNTAATPMPFAAGKFLVGASAGREAERAENAKKSNLAMSIDLASGTPEPKILWRNEQATPSFGSPMVHAGHAYWVNRQGVVYCLDVETGETKYVERTKQSIWATPLGLGNRVYIFGKDGLTTVLAAGPKFEILAENHLWDPAALKPDPARAASEDTAERKAGAAMFAGATQYGVAAITGSLLIRTGDKLYCLRP